MAKDRFTLTRHLGKDKEEIRPRSANIKGPWTHKKRQPVKIFTAEERARFLKDREGL